MTRDAVPGRITALVEAAAAGGEPDRAALEKDANISSLFSALGKLENDDARRPVVERLLSSADPVRVARVGMTGYSGLDHRARWELIRAAERVSDVRPLVQPYLAAWRKPKGKFHWGDMAFWPRFSAAIGAQPEVVEQLVADVAAAEAVADSEDEHPFRRAEKALALLVQGGSARGVAAAIAVIRRHRGIERPWRFDAYVRMGAYEALARHGDARARPTLLHGLGTQRSQHGAFAIALERLAQLDPDGMRARLVGASDACLAIEAIAGALGMFSGDDVTARLVELARHPDEATRRTAGTRLRERGVEPAPYVEPDPATLITHAHLTTRQAALRKVSDRRDVALVLSLAAAAHLDLILRRRAVVRPELPFNWADWKDALPVEIRRQPAPQMVEWARDEGARRLGEQEILPAVVPILERGAEAVADATPSPRLPLDETELAALLAEEAAMLGAPEIRPADIGR